MKDSTLKYSLKKIPPHLNNIASIFLKIHISKYAVTTDNEKAFMNVWWRCYTFIFLIDDPTNPNGQIVNFRFRSVLFGSCSPLILNAILMKHFKENVYMHAEVNRRSLNWQHNFKTRTEEELISLYNQIRSIFAKAGFNLRTWGSHNEVLKKCRKDEMLDKDCVFKVLEISKRIM